MFGDAGNIKELSVILHADDFHVGSFFQFFEQVFFFRAQAGVEKTDFCHGYPFGNW